MPEHRLSRARGECRCPDGVCLYRSGNAPGYCRQEVTRQRAEPRCTVQAPEPGLFCDRELGHAGPHRGYRPEQDAVVFWVGPSWTGDGPPAMCPNPTCGRVAYQPPDAATFPPLAPSKIPPGDY